MKKHSLEDRIFEKILTEFERNGIRPKLDESARKLHSALVEYSLKCWDCYQIQE